MTAYYVLYHFVKQEDDNVVTGLGSTTFIGPLDTSDMVTSVASTIKDHIQAETVVIMNWLELPGQPPLPTPVEAPTEPEDAPSIGGLIPPPYRVGV